MTTPSGGWAKEIERLHTWGVSVTPDEGLMLRQLLPHDHAEFKSVEARRQWRWALWDVEPITYAEAVINHGCELYGERGWAAVICTPGPKGGWTGAVFALNKLHGRAMPRKKNTLYFLAWVFDDLVPSHRNVPQELLSRDRFDQRRAHLLLHAPT